MYTFLFEKIWPPYSMETEETTKDVFLGGFMEFGRRAYLMACNVSLSMHREAVVGGVGISADVTTEWFLVGVGTLVPFQFVMHGEAFTAQVASIRPLSGVYPNMFHESRPNYEPFIAHITNMRLDLTVYPLVFGQTAAGHDSDSTHFTHVLLFTGMKALMVA